MSNMKKLIAILTENTAGSVASVSSAVGGSPLKQSKDTVIATEEGKQTECATNTTSSPSNFAFWKNSVSIAKEQQGKHGRKKSTGVVDKTVMYPQLEEGFKQSGQDEMDNLRRSRQSAERNAGLNEPDESPASFNGGRYSDLGTWHFKYDDGSLVMRGGKPLLTTSKKNAGDIVDFASKKGHNISMVAGAPQNELGESDNAPRKFPEDMADYTEEDWEAWDAMVSGIGQSARNHDEREAAMRKPESNGEQGMREGNDKNKSVPPSTPRNFVAKNAKTSGAGAHKDEKRSAKQGNVKHKSQRYEFAEADMSEDAQAHTFQYYDPRDDKRKTYVAKAKSKNAAFNEFKKYVASLKSMSEATGDAKFDSMMGDITSPEALDTREALALIRDLVYGGGASYEEALHQASVSFGIKRSKLHDLYKKQGMMENHSDDTEHDIDSLQQHFGPGVAYDAASHSPSMMQRADKNGKSTQLVRQSNGKYRSSKEQSQGMMEGYTVTRGIDKERYQERQGLEGPFSTKSGKVVYYDKVEGKYYDPDTDMYIEYDDWQAMNEQGLSEVTGDTQFDAMMKRVTKAPTQAQRRAENIRKQKEREAETRAHFANGGGFGPSPADKLSIRKEGVAEGTKTGDPVYIEGCEWDDVVNWLVKNVGPITKKNPNYAQGYEGRGWILYPTNRTDEEGLEILELSANTKLANKQVLAKTIQMACSGQQGLAEAKKTMSRAAKDLTKIRAKYDRYDESIAEGSEITEEMIADRLKEELALFKSGTKAKNKSISGKPANKEIQKKKSAE